jgi:Phytochelatin synthase
MTVSETTRLLPLLENHDFDYPTTSSSHQIRRGSWFYVLGLIGLTAAVVVCFGSRRSALESSSVAAPEFYPDDAVLLQWDVWRSEAACTMSTLGDSVAGVLQEFPNATHSLQTQLQSDTSRLETWWDGTAGSRESYVQGVAENAQRFGDLVQHWWDDAAVTSARAIDNTNVSAKVHAIETRFQHWWAHASVEERSWWNATEQQLQVDGQRGGDWLHQTTSALGEKSSAWADATKSAMQENAEKAEHAGAQWFNETSGHVQTWEGKWMDASKKELSKDKAAIAHVGNEWLNETEAALHSGEEKATEAWQTEEQAAQRKGAEFLNKTGAVVRGEEAVAAEQAGKWWHSVKDAAHGDVVALQDDEHGLWNASQAAWRHDRDAAEERFALWWSTTQAYAQSKRHQASEKEEAWWNATKLWLRDHIALLPPKSIANGAEKNSRALMYLNDSYAYSLLMNGYHWLDYSSDFFLLQGGWDVQVNQGYCAIASAAAVMNSFRPNIEIPIDPIYSPHPYATQHNLFNHCVQKSVVLRNATYDGLLQPPGGLSLLQLQQFLHCHDLNATLTYVNPANVSSDSVRQDLRAALMNPQQRVIVNYDRPGIGQEGGGHFSPLGAYAPKQDAFLLLDVAKYKYPPVWIPTERLYIAMAMEDGCGEWAFPNALDKVSYSFTSNSSKEYERILRRLKCRKTFRGYIVVQLPV